MVGSHSVETPNLYIYRYAHCGHFTVFNPSRRASEQQPCGSVVKPVTFGYKVSSLIPVSNPDVKITKINCLNLPQNPWCGFYLFLISGITKQESSCSR